jgi:hypothetical protein
MSRAGQLGAGAASHRPAVRYPVTLLLGLQYVALAVFPAIINSNRYLPFIVSIVGVALVTSLLVESLLRNRGTRRATSPARAVRYPGPLACWTVTIIGAFALLADTALGGGIYSTQVRVTAASPLTTLLTPLLPWLIFGCGFALASWRAGVMSRRATLLLVVIALAVELTASFRIAKLAGLMNFGFALGAGLILVGFFRARWLWVGLAVAVFIWPTLYTLRNETRQAVIAAGVPYANASTRLREDVLLQQAAVYGQSLQVDEPGPIDIVRFGLIPRFLDPGRGTLSTAIDLSVALGGANDSAGTFTVLGTVWSLNGGYAAVLIYVGSAAAAFALLYRRITPMRLGFAMLFVSTVLWIEATYPDNVAGLLQGFVSLLVAMGLSAVLGLRQPPTPVPLETILWAGVHQHYGD